MQVFPNSQRALPLRHGPSQIMIYLPQRHRRVVHACQHTCLMGNLYYSLDELGSSVMTLFEGRDRPMANDVFNTGVMG